MEKAEGSNQSSSKPSIWEQEDVRGKEEDHENLSYLPEIEGIGSSQASFASSSSLESYDLGDRPIHCEIEEIPLSGWLSDSDSSSFRSDSSREHKSMSTRLFHLREPDEENKGSRLSVIISLEKKLRGAAMEVEIYKTECINFAESANELVINLQSVIHLASLYRFLFERRRLLRLIAGCTDILKQGLSLFRRCGKGNSSLLRRKIISTSSTDFEKLTATLDSFVINLHWQFVSIYSTIMSIFGPNAEIIGSLITGVDHSERLVAATKLLTTLVVGDYYKKKDIMAEDFAPSSAFIYLFNGTFFSISVGNSGENMITEVGIINALIFLLKKDPLDPRVVVAANLLSMAAYNNDHNKAIMIDSDAISLLIFILRKGPFDAQLAAAGALDHLSGSEKGVLAILKEKEVPFIISLLSKSPIQLRIRAAILIMIMSSAALASEQLAEANVVAPLVDLVLKSPVDPEGSPASTSRNDATNKLMLETLCARALYFLSLTQSDVLNRQNIMKSLMKNNGLGLLFNIVNYHHDDDLRTYCMLILRNIFKEVRFFIEMGMGADQETKLKLDQQLEILQKVQVPVKMRFVNKDISLFDVMPETEIRSSYTANGLVESLDRLSVALDGQ